MTVFEVNRIFNGVSCPHCDEKVTISFNSDNLFAPFRNFAPSNEKECCRKFNEQLNDFLFLYRQGHITEFQLIGELNLYK